MRGGNEIEKSENTPNAKKARMVKGIQRDTLIKGTDE